ncbi:MAG: ATP-binding protein, partial [Bacteroidales bacterium]|nr:ATP-binding protein [Bacteroidales bacterium]
MKIIGRDAENAKLKSWYRSGKAEFIAIYGRRRVGKTYLVNTFFDNQFTFDATGIIGGTRTEELDAFYSALVEYGYSGPKPKKWMEAFESLKGLLKE